MKPFLSLPLDTAIAFNAAHRSYTFHGAKHADHTFGRKDLRPPVLSKRKYLVHGTAWGGARELPQNQSVAFERGVVSVTSVGMAALVVGACVRRVMGRKKTPYALFMERWPPGLFPLLVSLSHTPVSRRGARTAGSAWSASSEEV